MHRRIEGVGEFEVTLDVESGIIRSVNIGGDFFLLSDIDSRLLTLLEGIPYNRKNIEQAIANVDVSKIIHGLNTTDFINLLF